jgi:hypothetical protein
MTDSLAQVSGVFFELVSFDLAGNIVRKKWFGWLQTALE